MKKFTSELCFCDFGKKHVFLLSMRDLNFYGKYAYTLISYFSTFSENKLGLMENY